jgi:hypothetical protein
MLTAKVSRRTQLACAWCGPLFLVFFGIGMVPLAGFVPPPTAHDTPRQVVQLYTSHHARVQAGLVLMMLATGFIGPWVAAISTQLRRIGERVTALVYTQLATGASLIIVVLAPVMVMIVASFRPERDPQITQALNDLAWIPFIMVFPPLAAQMASIALAVFSDDAEAVFPRWVGYLNLWCVVLLFPAVLIPFFKTGPFAWHGIFQFWLAALIFFGWMAVMSVMLLKAVRTQPA